MNFPKRLHFCSTQPQIYWATQQIFLYDIILSVIQDFDDEWTVHVAISKFQLVSEPGEWSSRDQKSGLCSIQRLHGPMQGSELVVSTKWDVLILCMHAKYYRYMYYSYKRHTNNIVKTNQ